jgi:hypothetical protein
MRKLIAPLIATSILVVPSAIAAPPQSSATSQAASQGIESDAALIQQLRSDSQAQLDAIFRASTAGPMPGMNVEAKGYVMLSPGAPYDPALQRLFMLLWQGKVWYTNANGGYLFNRMIADIKIHYHRVLYGNSVLDGKKTILVLPGFPVDQFFDNIRMVRNGIYLGYSYSKPEYGVSLGQPHRMLNFVLDFNNPAVTPQECPQCIQAISNLGLTIQWPLGPQNPLGLG